MSIACGPPPGGETALSAAQDWVWRLGGKASTPLSFVAGQSFAIGRTRFDGLADEVEAPTLALHYVSVTLTGTLQIEARRDGEKRSAHIRPGQSVIMAAGCRNSWRWDGPTEEAHVFVKPDFLADVAAEAGHSIRPLEGAIAVSDPALSPTIVALADELARPLGPSRLFVDLAAQNVALCLLRWHCGAAAARCRRGRDGALTPRQLRRVAATVEDRLAEDIGLDDLAAAACTSRFHFVRAFKAATGTSPHRWLTALRMERARHLLAHTKMPVIEIAAEIGFESQSHFGAIFRAQTGCTPRDWRRYRGGSEPIGFALSAGASL